MRNSHKVCISQCTEKVKRQIQPCIRVVSGFSSLNIHIILINVIFIVEMIENVQIVCRIVGGILVTVVYVIVYKVQILVYSSDIFMCPVDKVSSRCRTAVWKLIKCIIHEFSYLPVSGFIQLARKVCIYEISKSKENCIFKCSALSVFFKQS